MSGTPSQRRRAAGPDTTTPVSTRDALMAEVGKLLNEGLTGAEVARRLNASGKRTANGAQFAWLKRDADQQKNTTCSHSIGGKP